LLRRHSSRRAGRQTVPKASLAAHTFQGIYFNKFRLDRIIKSRENFRPNTAREWIAGRIEIRIENEASAATDEKPGRRLDSSLEGSDYQPTGSRIDRFLSRYPGINLGPKQVASFVSECLVCGFVSENGEVALAVPERKVENGARLA